MLHGCPIYEEHGRFIIFPSICVAFKGLSGLTLFDIKYALFCGPMWKRIELTLFSQVIFFSVQRQNWTDETEWSRSNWIKILLVNMLSLSSGLCSILRVLVWKIQYSVDFLKSIFSLAYKQLYKPGFSNRAFRLSAWNKWKHVWSW